MDLCKPCGTWARPAIVSSVGRRRRHPNNVGTHRQHQQRLIGFYSRNDVTITKAPAVYERSSPNSPSGLRVDLEQLLLPTTYVKLNKINRFANSRDLQPRRNNRITLWCSLLLSCHMGTAVKHPVPDRVKPSFEIFDIRTLWCPGLSVIECPDVKNYKWRLNPVWHRMLYSCTHMATVGVKGLTRYTLLAVYLLLLFIIQCRLSVTWHVQPKSLLAVI